MKVRPGQFNKVRVLVVGDLVADHYVYGQTERVSREAPVLVVRHEREEVKLGGGANVAANARALGAHVTALGLIGRDSMGKAMRALFAAQGISLRATASAVTETKTRVLAGGVSTSRQQMIRIDRGLTGEISSKLSRALERSLESALPSCDVVIVSDYGSGVLNARTRQLLRAAAGSGLKVCVDSRFSLAAYRGFTVCKPNEPELGALTGMPIGDEAQLTLAAQCAIELLDCRVLVVTRGRHGMSVFERGHRPVSLPAIGRRDAIDVTGAGDTVSAAFALALGSGASAVEAAKLANLAGSLVVQKPGTATITIAELKAAQ